MHESGINPLPHKVDFYQAFKKAFETIVGKGENAGYQHFLLFPSFFLLNQQNLRLVNLALSQAKSFENTVGKGQIACDEQILLFPQCFLPVMRVCCNFHQI